MLKKIFLFLLAAFVVIQFIHPKPNKSKGDQPYYIGKTFSVPEEVNSILTKACKDCHSNNTRYPWYSNIQPADWWMNGHIKKGKKGMNLDEYTSRSLRYQYNKMKDVIEQIKEGEMPLNSYTWIHKKAILSQSEKDALINWAGSIMDTLKAKYPMDSLIRKK
jgi:DNA replicative helicase MCM subunit Mcm2 (Cdc46/Mcm family)